MKKETIIESLKKLYVKMDGEESEQARHLYNMININIDNCIAAIETCYEKEVKKPYTVTVSAEGPSYGIVYLTDDEYDIVRYVIDRDNWKESSYEMYSGSFSIVPFEEEK